MKKLTLTALAAALAFAVPAQAERPADPGHQRSERGAAHNQDRSDGKSRRCQPRKVGYVARGSYVSGTLTQTAGADTADERGDDRYSGTVIIEVKRTNRHARADKDTTKTYTLTDARVGFADRDGDGTRDLPVAGDRTKVQGKITRLNRRCDQTGFEPELTVKRVKFHKPAQA